MNMFLANETGSKISFFKGGWHAYELDAEVFVHEEVTGRLLKVRPEFVEALLTSGAQSVSALLGEEHSRG